MSQSAKGHPAGQEGDPFRTLRERIEETWARPERVLGPEDTAAVHEAVRLLDQGRARIAEPGPGGWRVNGWLQMAILLYFRLTESTPTQAGPLRFRDKIPVKEDLAARQVRVVPPGTARYGSFLEPGVVLMPGYVNIGAYVGAGTMIDTWATVGSGAQIGRDVHLSGGVGIGGVLEPPQAMPVIIEDGVFIGSRCVVVEGVRVAARAVLGAGCILTASTPIVDVRGSEPVVTRGLVPPGCVVIPGTWPRRFPAGEYHTPCVLLIGERKTSTDAKTMLNEMLRDLSRERDSAAPAADAPSPQQEAPR
jgi:2,3,4,5-tetrahydropyridine-2,6-dicarboxylate N-succinyltransferase